MDHRRSAIVTNSVSMGRTKLRRILTFGVIALTSASAGLTVTVTIAGRALPGSASIIWLVTLCVTSLLFVLWSLSFAHLVRRRTSLSQLKSIYLAALCNLPLLGGLGLTASLYLNDRINHIYSASAQGDAVFRPLALGSLIVIPSALQLISILLLAWRRLIAYLPIALVVLVAVVLRFWSLDWQLPYLLHNDERGYISTAMIMWAHGDANPHHFVNPSVLFYIDAILFNLLGGSRSESFRIFLETFGRQFWDPNGIYLVALTSRCFVATLGVSTVVAVYLAAKELFGKQAGLFASLFLAVSFLHVRNSHYGTTDIPATALATLSFLFAARIYRTGHLRDYILAGVLGGLATSTKYNAGMFVLPIIAAHLARQRYIGPSSNSTKTMALHRIDAQKRPSSPVWAHLPFISSFFISGIAFVMASPFTLLDWGAFSRDFRAQYGYGASPWGTQDALPTWWMQLATLVHGFGLLPLILALIGIMWTFRYAPIRLWIVASFPSIYYIFMSGQQLHFARFTIPLIPFIAIFSGCGFVWLKNKLGFTLWRRIAFAVILILAIAQPSYFSVLGDILSSQPDTRVLADQWASANIPAQCHLFLDDYSDMRPSQPWPSRKDLQVQVYDPIKDPTPWIQIPERPVYVVTSSFGWELVYRRLANSNAVVDPYKRLTAEGQLVASFSPGNGEAHVEYSIDDTYTPFWHLTSYKRPGPTVHIFRFD